MLLCYDVLMQYLYTGDLRWIFAEEIFEEIRSTYCYRALSGDEWEQLLHFITSGGNALQQYDEYKKVEIEDGIYKIKKPAIAMRHRLHIGTIVSEPMMKVRLMSGGFIGVIEEWFISGLNPVMCFLWQEEIWNLFVKRYDGLCSKK